MLQQNNSSVSKTGRNSLSTVNEESENTSVSTARNTVSLEKLNEFYTGYKVLVIELALVFGGLMLILHFAYIRQFPDLDWSSLTSLLLLNAVTGGFFISFFILLFVIPVVTWSTFTDGTGKELLGRIAERQRKSLLYDEAGHLIVRDEDKTINAKESYKSLGVIFFVSIPSPRYV